MDNSHIQSPSNTYHQQLESGGGVRASVCGQDSQSSSSSVGASIAPGSHREYSYTQCYTYTVGRDQQQQQQQSGQAVASHVNNSTSSRTARSSVSEMESFSEADENNRLLEEFSRDSTSSPTNAEHPEIEAADSAVGGLPPMTDKDEGNVAGRRVSGRSRGGSGSASGSNLNLSSESNQDPSVVATSPHDAITKLSHHQTAAEILNKRESQSHSYHFKRKYNFRSDSVFSDVMPMPTTSAQDNNSTPKSPGPVREKSGSLSSLKGQGSKWASLRKKLGRLNSPSSGKHQQNALEHQAHLQQQMHQQHHHSKTAKSSLEEKRSLLQRAKTLAILPVRGVKSAEDAIKKQPKEPPRPPELFNVGGEMNLIPLELLIDINDLNIQQ